MHPFKPGEQPEKPYTMDDLSNAMKERDWQKSQLDQARAQVRTHEGALKSALEVEAKHAKKLAEEEAKVRDVIARLEK